MAGAYRARAEGRSRLVPGLATAAMALSAASPAAAVSWIPDADGNWANAANWSGGLLPGLLDDVLIDVGGPTVRTITHNSGATQVRSIGSAENLLVSGGTLAVSGAYSNSANTRIAGGTLRLDGMSTLARLDMISGTLEGGGLVTIADASFVGNINRHSGSGTTRYLGPVSTFSIGHTARLSGGRTLEYAGGFTTDPNQISVAWNLSAAPDGGGGTLRNAVGSVMLDRAGGGRVWAENGGPAKFENFGTYRKDRNNVAAFTTIETEFLNSGTVEAIRGRIEIIGRLANADATRLSGGSWIVHRSPTDAPGLLWFDPASGLSTITVNSADISFNGAGAVDNLITGASFGQGPGQTLKDTLRVNAEDGIIRLSNGASLFSNSGTIINNGLIVLDNGDIVGQTPGLEIFNNGEIRGSGAIVGVVLQTGGVFMASGGILRIASTAVTDAGTIATAPGATLFVSSRPDGEIRTVDRFDHQGIRAAFIGGTFALNVRQDYTNAGFGVGDAFFGNANQVGANILATSAGQVLSAQGLSGGDTATPMLDLGVRRVGDATPVLVTITNTGAETTLRGAVRTAGAPLLAVAGGDSFTITPGGTAEFSISAAGMGAGAIEGQSVVVANNFANVADQTLAIGGTIYRLAEAGVSAALPPMVVRLGDTVPAVMTVSKLAAADGFSEGLVVNIAATGAVGSPDANGFILLAGNSRQVAATIDTSSAGRRQGSFALAFGSGGAGSSGLDPIAIGTGSVDFDVMVNNRAAPVFTRNGVALGFDDALGGYVLDLGRLALGGVLAIDGLALGNLVAGPADDLTGLVSLLSGGPWLLGDAFDVGLLGAGALSGAIGLGLDTAQRGSFLGELGFSGRGLNLSDPDGEDRFARLFVRANIVGAQGVIPEPHTWAMLIIGFGATGWAARRRRAATAGAASGR